jgi:hypothetical protein
MSVCALEQGEKWRQAGTDMSRLLTRLTWQFFVTALNNNPRFSMFPSELDVQIDNSSR